MTNESQRTSVGRLTLSTMNNILNDSNSNSSRQMSMMLDLFTQLFHIVGDTHAYYTWSPKSCGCILPTMHCRPRHCWELLHPCAHHCQHGRGNSQHCEPNNVGSCCLVLHVPLRFGLNIHVIRQKWRCHFSICLIIRTFNRWVLLIMLYKILKD